MVDVLLRRVIGHDLDEEIPVTGSRFVIGRAADCDLRPVCPIVSRHHCELTVSGDEVAVRDLESKNRTYVNEERIIGKRMLKSGDLLGFGMCLLQIHITPLRPDAASERRYHALACC